MAALLKTQYTLVYTSTLEGGEDQAELTISIDSQGSQVSETVSLGKLPVIQESVPTEEEEVAKPTLTPTTTLSPSETPTTVTASPTPTQSPKGLFQVIKTLPWWAWVLGAGLLVILAPFILIAIFKRKPKPEKCANCGFDITGKKGPCPQCGSTRRLPKS